MTTAKRILLIEDEESMIAGLEYALAKEGFTVTVARDGEKALAWLRKGAQPTEQVQKLLTVSGVWAQFESEKGGRVDTKLARRRLDDPKAAAKRAKKAQAAEAAAPEAEAPAAAADQPAAEESAADESAGEGTEESGDE